MKQIVPLLLLLGFLVFVTGMFMMLPKSNSQKLREELEASKNLKIDSTDKVESLEIDWSEIVFFETEYVPEVHTNGAQVKTEIMAKNHSLDYNKKIVVGVPKIYYTTRGGIEMGYNMINLCSMLAVVDIDADLGNLTAKEVEWIGEVYINQTPW
jgi:hypothetical protein